MHRGRNVGRPVEEKTGGCMVVLLSLVTGISFQVLLLNRLRSPAAHTAALCCPQHSCLNVFPVWLPNFSLNLLLLLRWLQLLSVQSHNYYYHHHRHHHPHSSRHSSSAGSHNSAGPTDQALPVHCYAKHLLAMQHACSLHYAAHSRAETNRCYRTRPL